MLDIRNNSPILFAEIGWYWCVMWFVTVDDNMWLQQDGATYHTARETLQLPDERFKGGDPTWNQWNSATFIQTSRQTSTYVYAKPFFRCFTSIKNSIFTPTLWFNKKKLQSNQSLMRAMSQVKQSRIFLHKSILNEIKPVVSKTIERAKRLSHETCILCGLHIRNLLRAYDFLKWILHCRLLFKLLLFGVFTSTRTHSRWVRYSVRISQFTGWLNLL